MKYFISIFLITTSSVCFGQNLEKCLDQIILAQEAMRLKKIFTIVAESENNSIFDSSKTLGENIQIQKMMNKKRWSDIKTCSALSDEKDHWKENFESQMKTKARILKEFSKKSKRVANPVDFIYLNIDVNNKTAVGIEKKKISVEPFGFRDLDTNSKEVTASDFCLGYHHEMNKLGQCDSKRILGELAADTHFLSASIEDSCTKLFPFFEESILKAKECHEKHNGTKQPLKH